MISRSKGVRSAVNRYHSMVMKVLDDIERSERPKIEEAAALVFECIEGDGIVHAFGTGHSHILVEEMFYRAGGLVPVNPVFVSSLMLHEGAARSSAIERIPELGRVIADYVKAGEGDLVFVFSNSGVNSVPVEFAIRMKERGLTVLAITSFDHSRSVKPRNPQGLRLFEIADVSIDNHVPYGDASVRVGKVRVAPLSTIAGVYIVNSIVEEVASVFEKNGKKPPVFVSANVERGDLYNEELIRIYSRRIPTL